MLRSPKLRVVGVGCGHGVVGSGMFAMVPLVMLWVVIFRRSVGNAVPTQLHHSASYQVSGCGGMPLSAHYAHASAIVMAPWLSRRKWCWRRHAQYGVALTATDMET